MRISDWSSDVCSSDLDGTRRVDDGLQVGVVVVEHVGGYAVQQGSVQRVELLRTTQHRRLARAGERLDRGQRAVGGLVGGAADGAAHPVHEGAHALRAHLGGNGGSIQASDPRSEEHTSELQSLMRHSYAVFWLNKKKK